jgi:hypothetical protein
MVEHGNFVVMEENGLTPLVIQQYNVVSFFLAIVDDDVRTPLTEGLDDLTRLRPRASVLPASKPGVSAAETARHLPGFAVGYENARFI